MPSMLGRIGSLFLLAFTNPFSTSAVSLPDCQQAAPPQKLLSSVHSSSVIVPGTPWGIAYASQKDRAFVPLTGLNANGTIQFGNGTLGVLDTSVFPPSLIHQIPLPISFQPPGTAQAASAGIAQLSLSSDGCQILIGAGPGGIIIDSERALAGDANAVIGTLNGTTATSDPGDNAVAGLSFAHDKYAIIVQEHGSGPAVVTNETLATPGNLNVFKLQPSSKAGVTGISLGYLELGYNVGNVTESPGGRYFYATSERYTVSGIRMNAAEPCSDLKPGFISVINSHQLKETPAAASHIDVPAGYAPVRIAASSNGQIVWAVSRESNALLAYNASKLLIPDPESSNTSTAALIASVQVGSSPVSLAFVKNETRIITTDSNRFKYAGAVTGLTVVDVEAVLAGKGNTAVLGRIETGDFPRDLAVSPDGKTVLVTEYVSGRIQAIDVETVP